MLSNILHRKAQELQDRSEKREAERAAEREDALVKEAQKVHDAWSDYYERREAALSRGEPFDEAPPARPE